MISSHPVPTPNTDLVDDNPTSGWYHHFSRRELVNAGLTKFDDKPEHYRSWKATFLNALSEIQLSNSEQLDLLIKWSGSKSSDHLRKIKAVHINDPGKGLLAAWECLE